MSTIARTFSWLVSAMSFGFLGLRDFRVLGDAIVSPNAKLFIEMMANRHYTKPILSRVVTFDVRDENCLFRHHIQTDVSWFDDWSLVWHDSNTILITLNKIPQSAYQVGTDSMVQMLKWPLSEYSVSN